MAQSSIGALFGADLLCRVVNRFADQESKRHIRATCRAARQTGVGDGLLLVAADDMVFGRGPPQQTEEAACAWWAGGATRVCLVFRHRWESRAWWRDSVARLAKRCPGVEELTLSCVVNDPAIDTAFGPCLSAWPRLARCRVHVRTGPLGVTSRCANLIHLHTLPAACGLEDVGVEFRSLALVRAATAPTFPRARSVTLTGAVPVQLEVALEAMGVFRTMFPVATELTVATTVVCTTDNGKLRRCLPADLARLVPPGITRLTVVFGARDSFFSQSPLTTLTVSGGPDVESIALVSIYPYSVVAPLVALLGGGERRCVVTEMCAGLRGALSHRHHLRKLMFACVDSRETERETQHELEGTQLPRLEHIALLPYDASRAAKRRVLALLRAAPALRVLEAPLDAEAVPYLPAAIDVHWHAVDEDALDALRQWPHGGRVRFTHPDCVENLAVPWPHNVGFHTAAVTETVPTAALRLSPFSRSCVQRLRVELRELAGWSALHGIVRLLPALSELALASLPEDENAADAIAGLCNAVGPRLRVVACPCKYHHVRHAVAQRCPWAVFVGTA